MRIIANYKSTSILVFAIIIMSLFTRSTRSLSLRTSSLLRRATRPSTTIRCLSNVYDHQAIESKWQTHWQTNKVFKAPHEPGPKKKYILDMFPYPSGAGLHVGHPEGYTATDILARYWRMVGYDVLHPMGWDAFGLPAEQHAISTGTHPATTTAINIATFKRQLTSLGFSYDWDRELSTTDENYVRWTQWIFLQLFKRGLAYQSHVQVNWCPMLGTVLANEEVIDGKSERGGHPVERMPLRQWVLRITEYADRLQNDLCEIQWPEGTLTAQKQWIGKSNGFSLQFKAADRQDLSIEVFTTRLETLFGVTHVALAPEHPLVKELTTSPCRTAVEEYCASISSKSDLDRSASKTKTGVPLGSMAINPVTGEQVPIWVADYVLPNYGSGAVMAVPAHDERDFQFAQMYGIPLKQVIQNEEASSGADETAVPYYGDGLLVNSGPFSGMKIEEARAAMAKQLEQDGKGRSKEMYKLRDWVFSRQRYWGEPIPIYFPVEQADNSRSPAEQPHTIDYSRPIPVDESELPVRLPALSNFQPGNDPAGCLARATEWRFFQKDGKWFARETNTMPQWAGSCWYYLRFLDPKNDHSIFSAESSKWLPVDIYVGGQEHAVLHLLYARFWHKVLHDLKVVDHKEPFLKLVHQGMILGADGEKMSKSRGNVINPDDIVKEYGADALRLYEMFMGPLEAVKPWQTSQLIGVVRFRDKVFNLCQRPMRDDARVESGLNSELHRTIKKVTQDIEKMSFNTAISSLMILTNHLSNQTDPLPKEAVKTLLLLVSPFAPHLAEECWSRLGQTPCIAKASWPNYDESLCVSREATIVIQINGKPRAKIDAELEIDQETLQRQALDLPAVQKYVKDSQQIKKVVYVKGKILNIVV